MSVGSGSLWSIVLAGGEGERTRAFIEERLGYHKPKQYCAFVGTRSMFQHTVDRADALAPAEHRIVIAADGHRAHLADQLRGRERGSILFQPRNLGTAVGIFLALAFVRARDSNATVVVYPSDHFVYPESAFLDQVRSAVRIAREDPNRPLLLAARPTDSEPDYGWILPGGERDGQAREVDRFMEKPSRDAAREALRRGGLWNTLILASRLEALWELGGTWLPGIMPAFSRFCEIVRTVGDGQAALPEMYQRLPRADFSSDLLQRAARRLNVLELNGVWWSDWGRPERILDTLAALRKRAKLPDALAPAAREPQPVTYA